MQSGQFTISSLSITLILILCYLGSYSQSWIDVHEVDKGLFSDKISNKYFSSNGKRITYPHVITGQSVTMYGQTWINSGILDNTLLASFDRDYNLKWVRHISSSVHVWGGYSATDDESNTYCAGTYHYNVIQEGDTISFNTSWSPSVLFVTKYDSNGVRKWTSSMGGDDGGSVLGLQNTIDGKIVVTGIFRGDGLFGSDTLQGKLGMNSQFVSVLDSSGNFLWTKSYIGGTNLRPSSAYADPNGDIAVAIGATNYIRDNNGDTIHFPGKNALVVIKFDKNGNELFKTPITSADIIRPTSLVIDSNSNVFLSNYFEGLIDSINITPRIYWRENSIIKLNPHGKIKEGWIISSDDPLISRLQLTESNDLFFYIPGRYDNNNPFLIVNDDTINHLKIGTHLILMDTTGKLIWEKANYTLFFNPSLSNNYITLLDGNHVLIGSWVGNNPQYFDQFEVIDKRVLAVLNLDSCPMIPNEAIVNQQIPACEGDTVEFKAPSGYDSYLWSNGYTDSVIHLTKSDNFYMITTDSNGCGSVSLEYDMFFQDSIISLYHDGINKCVGEQNRIRTSPKFTNIQWSDGYTGYSRFIYTSGWHSLQAIDTMGCKVKTDSIYFNFHDPKPEILNNYDTIACPQQSQTISTVNSWASYFWSNFQTSSTIQANTGYYWVKVTDAYGCEGITDTIYIQGTGSIPHNCYIQGLPQFCEGDSVKLYGDSATYNYTWNTGETGPFIYALTGGSYYFEFTDTNNCTMQSNTVNLNMLAKPPINLHPIGDSVLCIGESVDLIGDPADQMLWSTGDTTLIITVTQGGLYWRANTSSNGCSDTAYQYVTERPPPPKPTFITSNNLLITQWPLQIQWYRNNQLLAGETNDTLSTTLNGFYQVEHIDLFGCRSISDSLEVLVGLSNNTPNRFYFYPNPTSDQINISSSEEMMHSIEIFNTQSKVKLSQKEKPIGEISL